MGTSSVCTVPVKRLKSDCNSELTRHFAKLNNEKFFKFEYIM